MNLSPPRRLERAAVTGLLALVLCLPWTLRPAQATEAATDTERQSQRICSTRYPYPGCTWKQIKWLEFGSKAKISNHYVKFRWNQSRGSDHALTGINKYPRANRNMRRVYNRAVDRYQHRFTSAAIRYPTWKGFKRASGCAISPAALAWCAFGHWLDEEVTKPVAGWLSDISRSVLKCGGKVLIGQWYDQALDKRRIIVITTKSIVVKTGPGAALAVGACVRDLYYDRMWNKKWNPFG
jgi:hypothetical protein